MPGAFVTYVAKCTFATSSSACVSGSCSGFRAPSGAGRDPSSDITVAEVRTWPRLPSASSGHLPVSAGRFGTSTARGALLPSQQPAFPPYADLESSPHADARRLIRRRAVPDGPSPRGDAGDGRLRLLLVGGEAGASHPFGRRGGR